MSPCSAVALVALASLAAPVPDAPTVYRWKLEKGKTFYQECTVNTDQQMKVMGQEIAQKQNQTFYYSWTVLSQDGTNWVLRQRIEAMKVEIDIGGNKITYDSTQPGNGANPLTDFFKALVGSEFTLTLNRDMKVVKVGGCDEFVNKLAAVNPQMKALLAQMISEQSVKEMVEPTFGALPPRQLEKGESWVKHCHLNMGYIGSYDMSYEYVIEGSDNKYGRFKMANVGFKYEPPANNDGGGLPFTITRADLKTKKGTGSFVFDIEKGRMDRSEMMMELEGQLDISIGGQDTNVELRQVQRTTMRVTDDNPLKK